MSETLFRSMLRRMIRWGRLTVHLPSGTRESFGPGGADAPEATVTIHEARAVRRLLQRPALALGECYTDGTLSVGDDRLTDLLQILIRAQNSGGMPAWYRIPRAVQTRLMWAIQRNTPLTARRNVAHHYDISDDLYRLFLDADMQYSCAYWSRPGMTLDAAQEAKKAHIARKLLIAPDMRVLDIGCGWGGMALTLARDYGARVTGVTLSRNQLATARARVAEAGLEDRIDLRLQDYRKLDEPFDRIVSVGMLEHVGSPQFQTYFDKVNALLAPDGVALIHSIVKSGPPRPNNAWFDKYIFPGSYAPSASEIYRAIERAGLYQCDDEALRLHYSHTLRAWRDRLEARAEEVVAMFDAAFLRMWRFYLASVEMSFAMGHLHVQQWQLAHDMVQVPITRDYLYAPEAAERPREMAAE
ncbi:SAM-dependent methyltransferase [Pseudoponticoccus marisrubri]|uniref:Cyclopropane-fatty-acyl-phospholipid synthase n=1 Tax=Pseudoponticoccus marisrubri TaxID=1685382 RepID=A0A0W7WIC7_9RHOB|nr:cyclopropane-fatty-acyl-phospholipid synthase family protein [Pseudoponticoccus marisrubri]KUF10232.1 cyclopropane-fatty-acyl-phospholipid synthase [Pseudoponticoccus marisrubri]